MGLANAQTELIGSSSDLALPKCTCDMLGSFSFRHDRLWQANGKSSTALGARPSIVPESRLSAAEPSRAQLFEIGAGWLKQGSRWCRYSWFPIEQRQDGVFTNAVSQCGEDTVRAYRLRMELKGEQLSIRWGFSIANGHFCGAPSNNQPSASTFHSRIGDGHFAILHLRAYPDRSEKILWCDELHK